MKRLAIPAVVVLGILSSVTASGQDAWGPYQGESSLSLVYSFQTFEDFFRNHEDDSAWSDVRVVPSPKAKLLAAVGPPVRRMEEMHPIEILRTPDGDTVFDMGQNMVGWVRVQLDPQASWAGRTITLKHAEVLDSNGNFYTENLRGATQQVQFILDEDRSIYEPHFTFQGFRYVAVDGYPGEVTLDRHRHPLRHEGHGYVRDVRQKPQSTSTEHRLGPEGELSRRAHGLPPARRADGVDGRRSSFRAHGRVQHGRRGFFTRWLADLAADQYDNGAIP